MFEYRDKNGAIVCSGDYIQSPDGIVKQVHQCVDQNGEEDLGIIATSAAFLKAHPDYPIEFFSLNQIEIETWEIIDHCYE